MNGLNHTATRPLDVRAVMDALRAASAAVDSAERTDGALRGLIDALVPQVADLAEIYVASRDGRLHLRMQSPAEEGRRPEGVDPLPGVGTARHAEAAAAATVAVRARAAAAVLEGAEAPVLCRQEGARPEAAGEAGVDVQGVALPLLRDDEAVGALYLGRTAGRGYARQDLDLLLDLGEAVSRTLENRRLRREARAARRAKSDFLAVMNHELRTPLTAVVGYADLLEAGIPGPVTEKQRRQLVRIKESAWDLLELIDGILGYARYEGEPPELHVRTVDPGDLLQGALGLVEGAAAEKGLGIVVASDPKLPAFPTDPEKARRILFHLLSNAVKFTPAGEVRVRIAADPEWVAFSVSDTGIGIRPEERGSLFEPFWQSERPETRVAGGAGMGLALAQKLTELLSGEIEVESEIGRGSTFTVRLPREGPHTAFL